MSRIHTPNLCLRCLYYKDGKCVKTQYDYCKITRSK